MNKSNRHGFTLVEILVVVMIIGIAAMIVVPTLGDNADFQVTSAGRQLVSSLLYAQTWAIASQQACKVVFNSTSNYYELQDQAGNVLENPVNHNSYRIDFPNNPQLSKVTIASVNFDGGNVVKFNDLGIPFNGSDTDLAAPGTVTLSAGGQTMTVMVEPVTGRILSP